MRLRGACGPLLLAIAAGFFAPLPATAQVLSTFDDFSAARIDGARWSGYASTLRFAKRVDLGPDGRSNEHENPLTRHPTFSTYNTTSHRRIVGDRLQLKLDSVGGTHPNPNVDPGRGVIGVSGRASSGNVVRVTVTPVAAEAPPCRTTGQSRVWASLTASVSWSTSQLEGQVFVTLALERSSFDGDRIYAILSRCRGWDCSVIDDLDRVVFNRAWRLGDAHTLTIRHQPERSRVVFTAAGGDAAAETRALRTPTFSDSTYVASGFDLQVKTTPANCPASGGAPAERVNVTMDADFDDVRVGAPVGDP